MQAAEARGEAIGEAIGEAREKIVIAKNLLKAGLSIDVIAESTGLSIEEIQKLTLIANESQLEQA
ncbi:hypothetical protein [Candidatus Tisiphia endosymbiont of Dioctria rufipes]|uniref:hypothetical protein n=1 Tax=Candidatus Tisiphia endosymbiont of Dioctria rufipes TaxID=3066255 RepID=UPI00312C7354